MFLKKKNDVVDVWLDEPIVECFKCGEKNPFDSKLIVRNWFYLGCYSQRYGTRGYGHLGFSSLGLMSDIKDKEWQRYLLSGLCLFLYVDFHVFCQ